MVQKYTSLYKDDPIAAELEAGIQGTDVYQGSPYALANVPEFEGIRYATPDYNRYQDLYNLYLGGGFDAAQDDFPIQAGDITGGQMVEAGAGDASPIGTIPLDQTGVTGVNTPFEQNLLDQGVGVQIAPGQPVVAPGEMPVTQAEMDAFNQIPVNTDYSPPTSNPFLVSGAAGGARLPEDLGEVTADDYGTPTVFDDTATLADAGAGMGDMYETDYQGEPYIEDDLMDYDEHYDMDMKTKQQAAEDAWKDIQTHNTVAGNAIYGNETIGFFSSPGEAQAALEAYAAKQTIDPAPASQALDDEYYEFDTPPTTDFPEQVDFQQGFIDAKDYSAPGTLADPMEKQDFVTEADMVNPSKLLQRLGLPADFDIKQAALEAGINLVAGVPITLIGRALGAVLPDGLTATTNLARETGLLTGDTTVTQDKYGINTQSALGDYTQYNVDRVEKLEDSMEKSKARHVSKHGSLDAKNEYNMTWAEMNKRNLQELEDRKEYLTVSGVGGDVEGDQPGMTIAEDIALQDRIDAGIAAADEEPGATIGDTQAIIPYGPMTEGDIEVTGLGDQEILDAIAAEEAAAEEAAAAEAAAIEQAAAKAAAAKAKADQEAAARREAAARAAAIARQQQQQQQNQGGGGRDRDPAPSAPAKTSQGVTSAQHSAFRR